jgi:hypothetical protein
MPPELAPAGAVAAEGAPAVVAAGPAAALPLLLDDPQAETRKAAAARGTSQIRTGLEVSFMMASFIQHYG